MINAPRIALLAGLLALGAVSAGPPSSAGTGPSDSARELERIKQEMQEKKKGLKRANRKERSILSQLDGIDHEIQAGAAALTEQQRQLQEAEAALRETESNSIAVGRELAKLKALYGLRLRALYKMHKSDGPLIAASDGLGGVVRKFKYLAFVALRDREIITGYGSALAQLQARETAIATRKESLLDQRRTVEAAKAELEAKRRRKKAILTAVRQEKGLYEDTLRELEEASVTLWSMVAKEQEEHRPERQVQPPRNGSAASGAKGLPWPLDGPVLTRFGMQRHPQFGTMVFRRGIEIQAKEGESVRAVDGGRVVFADWYKGYGKLVILDHGNGFYTLYGNLSRLDLSRDERAVRGQVIGLTGDTGNMKGPKLYFEIRKNGEAQDPIAWLANR